MKFWLYVLVVCCFLVAGWLDIKDGNTKEGVIAILFGTTNAIIFLWRTWNASLHYGADVRSARPQPWGVLSRRSQADDSRSQRHQPSTGRRQAIREDVAWLHPLWLATPPDVPRGLSPAWLAKLQRGNDWKHRRPQTRPASDGRRRRPNLCHLLQRSWSPNNSERGKMWTQTRCSCEISSTSGAADMWKATIKTSKPSSPCKITSSPNTALSDFARWNGRWTLKLPSLSSNPW